MFERSIQNNRYCFVEQARKSGVLHDADYYIIDQWYKWARANYDLTLDLIGMYKIPLTNYPLNIFLKCIYAAPPKKYTSA